MIPTEVEPGPTTKPRRVLEINEPAHAPPAPPVHPAESGGSFLPILIGCVILAVVGIGAWYLITRVLHNGPPASASALKGRAVPVVASAATRGDMPVFLTGLGTVTAYNTVTLRTRVDGQIMKINFNEGQIVQEGQLLLEVDPRPYQAQLAQAQGNLLRDQAQLKNDQLDLQRYQSIKNSVTQQQIDTQVALVQKDQGTVESDQSQVDNAKLNLVYCEVTAPISGRIGLRLVDVGNIVHATDTTGLAVITQLQPIAVIFTVPEDQISEVFRRPDHGQGLEIDAYNRDMTDKIATGKLLAIDNQVDPTTGTVRIKGEFANKDYALFPNQFVNARLLIDTLKGIVLAPSAAVQLGPQSTFVYVVKPDKTVQLQTVKEGHKEGGLSAIEEGIKPGDIVVTDGVDKLVSGSTVNVRMAGASGDASSAAKPAHAGGHHPGNGGATTKPADADAGEAK